jgi:hypothetical protein
MALAVLAVGLVVNSLLGPLGTGVVTYPFSETLVNQTIGLEIVSLLIVAPWCLVAAWLVSRRHRAGPLLALPPAAYTAYMFVQYIVGPQYVEYPPVIPLHLGIFVLSGFVLVRAWNTIQSESLPSMSEKRRRISGVVLLLFAVFVSLQYLSAAQGILTGASLSAEFVDDPSMYWSIFFLDLGIVVPVTIATSVGLFRGAAWAIKAVFGVVGWYTLVPISVSAMGVVMLLNGDPNAAAGRVVVLSVAALVFTVVAAWIYRPVLRTSDRRRRSSTSDEEHPLD